MILRINELISIPLMILILISPVLAVDINTATVEELMNELRGVGPVKARRIVEYRETISGFVTVEQLMEVRGIGIKTLERNRNRIELSPLPHNNPIQSKINLFPDNEKQVALDYPILWDIIVILPIILLTLFLFIKTGLKFTRTNKPIPRKHLIKTTFVCAHCGKLQSNTICYEGHLSHQYIDGDLPLGWSCIPNELGQLCDYCFDCAKNNPQPKLRAVETAVCKP